MGVQQRVVLVTGAGSGIGRACTLRFAREGAHVMLNDAVEALAAGTAALLDAEGLTHGVVVGDISDWAEAERAVEATVEGLGELDVLVANAGISLDMPFLEVGEDQFARTLAVNIGGVFACAQAAARAMCTSGRGGHIITVSSVFADSCTPGSSVYAASKGAVRSLTQALAIELGPLGIHVNAVAPGYVPTAMNDMLKDEDMQDLTQRIPLGRVGSPEEIAEVVAFLASANAAYINGETVYVDGGWRLGQAL